LGQRGMCICLTAANSRKTHEHPENPLTVSLQGNSPSALTAGILLLSKARSFGYGQRFTVEVVGDPHDIVCMSGPALIHSPVLASCGIGRSLGAGALVIVAGPAASPLAVSTASDGLDDWYFVDRTGKGHHPLTQS